MTITPTTLLPAILVVLAIGAIWFDVRERRIPNALTVSVFLLALVFRLPAGVESTMAGVVGAALCFCLATGLFLTGGLGGGDVKMLTAVGALLGPGRLATALLVMAVVGGVMAVGQVVRNRSYRETAANIHTILMTFGRKSWSGWKGAGEGAAITLDSPGAMSLPYGVPIALGSLAGWFLHF